MIATGDGGGMKSRFSVRIQTKADKYYLAEIIDDPTYSRYSSSGKHIVNLSTGEIWEEQGNSGLKFSLEMARRFYGITLRGGLIESEGGVGVDYNFWKDRVQVGVNAFDFARTGDYPVLQGMVSFQLSKYLFLSGGYYDFVSKHSSQKRFYAGGGITFLDEDLKTLLPFVPNVK